MGKKDKKKSIKNPYKRIKGSNKINVKLLISMICIIGAVICGWSMNNKTNSYNTYVKDGLEKIASLEYEIEELGNSRSLTKDDVNSTLNSASKSGNEVAELQNNYTNINSSVSDDAIIENATKLDAYFDEDNKNARTVWYYATANDVKSTWSFKSTYEYSGDKLSVIWVCTDDATGKILAYTSGTYSAKDNTFSDISHHITTLGAINTASTGNDISVVQEIVDSIGKIETSDEKQLSDDELNDLNDSQDKLRKQQEEKEVSKDD